MNTCNSKWYKSSIRLLSPFHPSLFSLGSPRPVSWIRREPCNTDIFQVCWFNFFSFPKVRRSMILKQKSSNLKNNSRKFVQHNASLNIFLLFTFFYLKKSKRNQGPRYNFWPTLYLDWDFVTGHCLQRAPSWSATLFLEKMF